MKWINVNAELPTDHRSVLLYTSHPKAAPGKEIIIGFWISDKKGFYGMSHGTLCRYEFITYWMPLPEPPILGKNIYKFDLERAKKGELVIRGDEYPVRIICFDHEKKYPLVGSMVRADGYSMCGYTNEGINATEPLNANYNLFMKYPESPESSEITRIIRIIRRFKHRKK